MTKIIVKIPASQENSYPIWINSGLFKQPCWLPKNLSVSNIVIITDHAVKKLYAAQLIHCLKKQGYKTLLLSFTPGEKSKNYKTKQSLENNMMQHHCGRDTLCIALGGGVVGDLTGYLAATYMRGIPYIQIPTTLLSMVDSSVGGKTGINTPYGKNIIGAFWQPKAVVADTRFLNSLPKKQLINGLVEALKMFLTHDKKSFLYLQKKLEDLLAGNELELKKLIHSAIKIKAHIVNQDEKENTVRVVLNFGHTIGHALEQVSRYKMLHGYAVAFGILVEAKIAQLMDLLNDQDYTTIQTIFSRLGFEGKGLKKFNVDKIILATRLDKKAKNGKAKYVLLKNIGQVYEAQKNFAQSVPDKIVKKAFLAVIEMR